MHCRARDLWLLSPGRPIISTPVTVHIYLSSLLAYCIHEQTEKAERVNIARSLVPRQMCRCKLFPPVNNSLFQGELALGLNSAPDLNALPPFMIALLPSNGKLRSNYGLALGDLQKSTQGCR
ncbi:hypothetical protein AC579_5340 [Pseudocercospora musae]|uniref:Uncharacterized protein n=1 Tax=Pseudocercospora musae TaxID=113226 RepID=A0A139IT72_9PEZI|nr:hypothetical protein AC579_5340 [Pseudocercospora musae]